MRPALAILLLFHGVIDIASAEVDFVDGTLIQFTGEAASPNGAWCWFQDERVIVNTHDTSEPVLMFTSVSASREIKVVLWKRGTYTTFTDFDTQIVGVVQTRK
jgi:hypothetical protein